MQQSERKSSRTRSPRGRSPSGRTSRWLCKDYFRGTCNNSFCERWHPPECLYYKTKSGCRFGEKCSYAHRQVDEQPTKRSKKNDDISAVAILKKGDWKERGLVTGQCRDRSGKPDKRSDKSWDKVISTSIIQCTAIGLRISRHDAAEVFSPQVHRHAEANPTCEIQKRLLRVTLKFEIKILRSDIFVQVNLMSVAPTLQILRMILRRRQSGKSKVPAKQRGSWPKMCSN